MPSARRSIWVVDDSQTDAEFASSALGEAYEVTTFLDGSTALGELATRPPLQREHPGLALAFDDFLLRTLADRINTSERMAAALGR